MSESFVSDFISKLSVNSDGVALDIGANHGIYSVKLAEKFGRVFAFEPHPENIKVLTELKTDPSCKFEIVTKAISDLSGTIAMFVNGSNPGGHTINAHVGQKTTWGHGGDIIPIEAVSLDDFCANLSVDFIKMDIESAEEYVWGGAVETLKKNKIDIILETHQTVDTERLRIFFEDLGYKWFDENMRQVTGVPGKDCHYLITNKDHSS